jgi:hypothetical protein
MEFGNRHAIIESIEDNNRFSHNNDSLSTKGCCIARLSQVEV